VNHKGVLIANCTLRHKIVTGHKRNRIEPRCGKWQTWQFI